MLGTLITLPSDFVPQTLEVSKSIFKMFSPILVPIIGVWLFAIVLRIIISRLVQPTAQGGANRWIAGIVRKKKLIALLSSTIGAFMTWFALQPPEFQQGFMLPFQLLTGLVVSDTALYTLATTLFGIAVAVLFL